MPWSGPLVSSPHKHRRVGAEHDENRDSNHDSRQPGARLILPQFAVAGSDENSAKAKTSEQASRQARLQFVQIFDHFLHAADD